MSEPGVIWRKCATLVKMSLATLVEISGQNVCRGLAIRAVEDDEIRTQRVELTKVSRSLPTSNVPGVRHEPRSESTRVTLNGKASSASVRKAYAEPSPHRP